MRELGSSGRSRTEYVDTIRAIACVALVSFHVLGGGPEEGLRLPADHWVNQFVMALSHMRMPLFSFISGFVFLAVSRDVPDMRRKIGSKARRLLVPCICVSTLFWLTRSLNGGETKPLWAIFFTPYAIYWFLQATFLLMTVFLVLTRLSGNRDTTVAAVLLVVVGAAWVLLPRPAVELFSWYSALYLCPFFMGGYLLARRRKGERPEDLPGTGRVPVCFAILAAAGYAAWHLDLLVWDRDTPIREVSSMAIGFVACLAMFFLRPSHPLLARIGERSYAVFLFHIFFTAASTQVLAKVVPDLPLVFAYLTALTAGIIGPIAVEAVLARHQLTARMFLGLKTAAPSRVAEVRS